MPSHTQMQSQSDQSLQDNVQIIQVQQQLCEETESKGWKLNLGNLHYPLITTVTFMKHICSCGLSFYQFSEKFLHFNFPFVKTLAISCAYKLCFKNIAYVWNIGWLRFQSIPVIEVDSCKNVWLYVPALETSTDTENCTPIVKKRKVSVLEREIGHWKGQEGRMSGKRRKDKQNTKHCFKKVCQKQNK